jgi:hypothetical protein
MPNLPREGSGGRPHYPEITESQWALITALTDQRCNNILDAADFISDLSDEAKVFLKNADKAKIEQIVANLEFFATSKAVWKFLWFAGLGDGFADGGMEVVRRLHLRQVALGPRQV